MEIQLFKKEEFGEVRTLEVNGEPWFVAKDICDCLLIKNTTQAMQKLDEDERTMFNIGRQGETNIINESGLYSLIMTSRKPEAKQFKKWVTGEVLPSIRKNGGYISGQDELSDMELLAKALLITQNIIEEKDKKIKLAENKIEEDKPKVIYYEEMLSSNSLMTTTVIAKDLGMSAVKLNLILHELGVQYKKGNVWVLYSKYDNKGYTRINFHLCDNGSNVANMKWTNRGRKLIYELLKENDLLPKVEQGE